MNKAIFLDRDGVINIDRNYVYKVEDFEFIPRAIGALKMLSKTDYKIIIITNQSGIGRELYTHEDLKKVMDFMYKEFDKHKIKVEKKYYFCPHHPTKGIGEYRVECDCRKPKTGMFKQAQKDFDIDMSKSFYIGDLEPDMVAGRNAGCKTIFVLSGHGKKEDLKDVKPDFIAKDLYEAVEVILDY